MLEAYTHKELYNIFRYEKRNIKILCRREQKALHFFIKYADFRSDNDDTAYSTLT